jgi:hypothetical protein
LGTSKRRGTFETRGRLRGCVADSDFLVVGDVGELFLLESIQSYFFVVLLQGHRSPRVSRKKADGRGTNTAENVRKSTRNRVGDLVERISQKFWTIVGTLRRIVCLEKNGSARSLSKLGIRHGVSKKELFDEMRSALTHRAKPKAVLSRFLGFLVEF